MSKRKKVIVMLLVAASFVNFKYQAIRVNRIEQQSVENSVVIEETVEVIDVEKVIKRSHRISPKIDYFATVLFRDGSIQKLRSSGEHKIGDIVTAYSIDGTFHFNEIAVHRQSQNIFIAFLSVLAIPLVAVIYVCYDKKNNYCEGD